MHFHAPQHGIVISREERYKNRRAAVKLLSPGRVALNPRFANAHASCWIHIPEDDLYIWPLQAFIDRHEVGSVAQWRLESDYILSLLQFNIAA